MNRSLLVLCLMAGACAPAAQTSSQLLPPASDGLMPYVGDYYPQGAGDTLYVREDSGRVQAFWRRHVWRFMYDEGIQRYKMNPVFPNGGTTFVLFAGDSAVVGNVQRVVLKRRNYGQGTFRITPLRPAAELRREALAATPPAQPDSLLPANLVELRDLDRGIKYDIRYATRNNFMGEVFYSSAHAFLQRPAAEAVARAHRKLAQYGYGLLIHDAYRPWYVTKMFWDATPDSLHDFVADPSQGSRHNRGAAVDLTLYDLRTGAAVVMPSGYDEFSARAFPNYPGGTTEQRQRRELLRRVMEEEGFKVYEFEWWHFDYGGWRKYRIGTATFEELLAK